jgi:hypothetical protein
MWSEEQQDALFSRLGFSFLNAPLLALTCALLVPLAGSLGYSARSALVLGAGFGVATLAWPYAKHDFSETAAACCAVAAAVALYAAHSASLTARGRLGAIAAAGALAALAAGAKYTAIWFLPLLAIQHVLLTLSRGRYSDYSPDQRAAELQAFSRSAPPGSIPTRSRTGSARYRPLAVELAVFFTPAAIAAACAVAVAGAAPTIWAGWRGGLARGWLDFPVWVGLYGLLLSPGKSVFLYAPPLLLALLGSVAFVRCHRGGAFVFVAVPLVYLAVFATKGVWHGGGWGPRYLVPALPFAACLALPVLARATATVPDRLGRAVRRLAHVLLIAGIGVQLLGVAKHPNLFGVMYRDHILPRLPDYGASLGGPPAIAYWRHFGGPGAFRQLARPPAAAVQAGDELRDVGQRSLGYLFAETGPLELQFDLSETRAFDATFYTCDWDRRGRRQRLTLDDQSGRRIHEQAYPLESCEYLTWQVTAGPGRPVVLRVDAMGPDVPVVSAVFFDPAAEQRADAPRRTPAGTAAWHERFGASGYVLFAWRRSGADQVRLPGYVAGYSGGDRVWIDTGEVDLADTAPLYAPAFSPVAAHAWLLGADAVAGLFPANALLLQRALASPPWRYLAGLNLDAPHPEYGLGLDFWPLLLRSHFSSHRSFMASVWVVAGALVAACTAAVVGLVRQYRSLGHPGAVTEGGSRLESRRALGQSAGGEGPSGGSRWGRTPGAIPVVGQDAARQ